MSKPFRAAILGCGMIAGRFDLPDKDAPIRTHGQGYHNSTEVTLAGVADKRGDRAAAFAERWGVDRHFPDLDSLLSGVNPHILSICTPSVDHTQDLIAAISHPSAPRVIVLEKPVCLDEAGARRVENAVEDSGVMILVNHTRRYDAVHQQLATRIQNGDFGQLRRAQCWYYGGWINNGIHVVDTLSMLLGSPGRVVSAEIGARGREQDPCLNVNLEYGDALVRVDSVDELEYQLFDLEFHFEAARLRFEDFGTQVVLESPYLNQEGERVLRARETVEIALQRPIEELIRCGIGALTGGKLTHAVGIPEALESMRLVWEVREMIK